MNGPSKHDNEALAVLDARWEDLWTASPVGHVPTQLSSDGVPPNEIARDCLSMEMLDIHKLSEALRGRPSRIIILHISGSTLTQSSQENERNYIEAEYPEINLYL